MGEKPLYYALNKNNPNDTDTNIIFASELKALKLHPNIDGKINVEALNQFVHLNYILGNQCILESTKKLPPAHYLLLERGKAPIIQSYWNLKDYFIQKPLWKSKKAASDKLQSLLKETVQDQMISDVPLGAFLSGGIDSSTIVAAMRNKTDGDFINTFSVGFKEKSYNELPFGNLVAKHLEVTHHTQEVLPNQQEILECLIKSQDEPFADTSMIPMYFLSEFARKQVKVCLSGDGGDELFAGYETYVASKLHRGVRKLPNFLQKGLSHGLFSGLDRLLPISHNKVSLDYKLRKFFKGCRYDNSFAHYFWRTIYNPDDETILQPDLHAHLDVHEPFNSVAPYFDEVTTCHPLDQALYVDMKTWIRMIF